MAVKLTEYLNKTLKAIDDGLKECGYKTCNKYDAHIILELELENCNITLNIMKTTL